LYKGFKGHSHIAYKLYNYRRSFFSNSDFNENNEATDNLLHTIH